MRITASARAAEVIAEMDSRRPGTLTVTIGTGCCESTAPFLYEDHLPGPDQERVGEVAGVTIFAPAFLRRLYPDDEGPHLEVVDELAESLSVETELGVRLVLRGTGLDASPQPEVCAVPDGAASASGFGSASPSSAASRASVAAPRPVPIPVERHVVGSPPPELEGLRVR